MMIFMVYWCNKIKKLNLENAVILSEVKKNDESIRQRIIKLTNIKKDISETEENSESVALENITISWRQES